MPPLPLLLFPCDLADSPVEHLVETHSLRTIGSKEQGKMEQRTGDKRTREEPEGKGDRGTMNKTKDYRPHLLSLLQLLHNHLDLFQVNLHSGCLAIFHQLPHLNVSPSVLVFICVSVFESLYLYLTLSVFSLPSASQSLCLGPLGCVCICVCVCVCVCLCLH